MRTHLISKEDAHDSGAITFNLRLGMWEALQEEVISQLSLEGALFTGDKREVSSHTGKDKADSAGEGPCRAGQSKVTRNRIHVSVAHKRKGRNTELNTLYYVQLLMYYRHKFSQKI